MSHDLFFYPVPDKEVTETEAEITRYFSKRSKYTIQGSEATYCNEDTGVYFSFEIGLKEMEGGEDSEWVDASAIVHFKLNYFRPHIFGLEAEPEVSAFVRAFGLPFEDPQIDGMRNGQYSPEGFLDVWNRGNDFGYDSIISHHGSFAAYHVMETSDIERYWRWNLRRSSLQAELDESHFVPKVTFMVIDGGLRSVAVWPDCVPSCLPVVDFYAVSRHQLPRREWFLRSPDMVFVPSTEAEIVLSDYELTDAPLPFRKLNYDQPPAYVVQWVSGLSSPRIQPEAVPVDTILNADLVRKYADA